MEALYFLKARLKVIFNHVVGQAIKPSEQQLRHARYVFQGCQRVELKDGSLGTRALVNGFQFLKLPDHNRSRSMKSKKRCPQILRRLSDFVLVCRLMQKRLSPHVRLMHDVERFSQNSYRTSRNAKYSVVPLPILLLNAFSFLLHQLDVLIVLPLCNHGCKDDRKDRADCLHYSRPSLNGRGHFWGHVIIPLHVLEKGF
ncbi:hypothetical protein XCCB1459_0572 [Xanthomonas campestris pv. campestris]|jgi:hypothetical protein|nr:hypothetical protein XCCB1459_0572 [Xanthomonas campestris pv. campestris]